MICPSLTSIGLSPAALLCGSKMHEVNTRATIDWQEIDWIHHGKDQSIDHMLQGGNGFAASPFTTHVAQTAFNAGCTAELRDMRSLRAWAFDVNQCLEDRKHGRVS